MSLVAHKATSRNVAFAEVNELLGASVRGLAYAHTRRHASRRSLHTYTGHSGRTPCACPCASSTAL
jgi:hypothetical protein